MKVFSKKGPTVYEGTPEEIAEYIRLLEKEARKKMSEVKIDWSELTDKNKKDKEEK